MLLDTSGLLCLIHRSEPFHQVSCELYFQAKRLICTNYILAELVALANARRLPRPSTLSFIADLLMNPDIEVFWVNQHINEEAMNLLLKRPDKNYSLCDAVSFITMKQERVDSALTTDRHFEQEGLTRLLC